MRTYIFYWADGHVSYESFSSNRELYDYIDQMSEEVPIDRYEEE